MKLSQNNKEIKNLINSYYNEVYGIKGTTTISVSEEYVGYGASESKGCVVKFIFNAKIKVLLDEKIIRKEINNEELKTIISYFSEKNGYKLKRIEYHKGLETKTEGYGYGEHTVNYPYFRGIEIEIEEKVKKK